MTLNTSQSGKKGLYVIAETGAMYPSTGASVHIRVGIEQLKRYFNIEKVLFCQPVNEEIINTAAPVSNIPRKIRSPFRRFIKWIHVLVWGHRNVFKYYKIVKRLAPDFIYERAAYLNYNGLIIARLLKIPHFYEVNGIAANDHSKYFPAICNKWAFRLEKWAYNKCTFGFYVGGINRYFDIPSNKFLIIQNGVDKAFADAFKTRTNIVRERVNITFIGNPMDHHRLDVLTEAMRLVKKPELFAIHFVGGGLEEIRDDLPKTMESKFYGSLSQKEIETLIRDFNIGIVTFGLDYSSHVKVFMYGAAKLLLLIPDSLNLKNNFDDDEAVFFSNAVAEEIAAKLDDIADNPAVCEKYGEQVYQKVQSSFTWEKIYEEVAEHITTRVPNLKS